MEAQNAEELWPLSPTQSGPHWLKFVEGKREIWKLAGPLTSDSVFTSGATQKCGLDSTFVAGELNGLPRQLAKICGLTGRGETARANAYSAAVLLLNDLFRPDQSTYELNKLLNFCTCMDVEFKNLLLAKDPKALLLLVYWHTQLFRSDRWWTRQRTLLEGKAICLYLRAFYATDNELVAALWYPETCLGADSG